MKNIIFLTIFCVLQLLINTACNTQPNKLPVVESDTISVVKEANSNNQDSNKPDSCSFLAEFTQTLSKKQSHVDTLDKARIAEYAYVDLRNSEIVNYCNTKIYHVSLNTNVFSKFSLKNNPNEKEITLKSELANCVMHNGMYITTNHTSRPSYQIDVCLQILTFKNNKSAMDFCSKFNEVKSILFTSMPSCAIQSEKVVYVLHARSVQFDKYMESIRNVLEKLKSNNIAFN